MTQKGKVFKVNQGQNPKDKEAALKGGWLNTPRVKGNVVDYGDTILGTDD